MRGQTTFIERAEVDPSVVASDLAANDEGRGRLPDHILHQLKTPTLSDFLGLFLFFDKLDRVRLTPSFVVVLIEP
jgi:hypothetical protein